MQYRTKRVKINKPFILGALALIPLLMITGLWFSQSAADEQIKRRTEIVVPYVEYEWWMLRWEDNAIACRIFADHEGKPNSDEFLIYCGKNLYEDWYETQPCKELKDGGGNTSLCDGFYLHQIASEVLTKTVTVDLPLPEAFISIDGCTPTPPENICPEIPNLLITAEEPLPNERIVAIEGEYNKIPFRCESSECLIPMRPTVLEGATVTFWAESSFGDKTYDYSALVRVVDSGVTNVEDEGGWHIDLMSSQMTSDLSNSCAQIWGAFPPVGPPPDWLSTPGDTRLLASDQPFTFLAGRLISAGIVDALDCPSGGIDGNGYANTCGLDKAREDVEHWQNRFDAQIIDVALETGIPAQLMKNLFAKESQFWPGAFTNNIEEFGLGQLTEIGADTVLLWNREFFTQFCPFVLDAESCAKGYANLDEEDQKMLRGALALDASASCEDCPLGIDLTQADFSINIFAQTLHANCKQVSQLVTNESGKTPGEVSNYEDLWRLTLANYHSGPGCLSEAIDSVPSSLRLNWNNIAPQLEDECPGTVEYVEEITE